MEAMAMGKPLLLYMDLSPKDYPEITWRRIIVNMKQHKKKEQLKHLHCLLPNDLHDWIRCQAKQANKSIGLYLTDLLTQVQKLTEIP